MLFLSQQNKKAEEKSVCLSKEHYLHFPTLSASLILFFFKHCFIKTLIVMATTVITGVASWGCGLNLPSFYCRDSLHLYKHRICLGLLWLFCTFVLLNVSLPPTETMTKTRLPPLYSHTQTLISLLTSNRNDSEKKKKMYFFWNSSVFLYCQQWLEELFLWMVCSLNYMYQTQYNILFSLLFLYDFP